MLYNSEHFIFYLASLAFKENVGVIGGKKLKNTNMNILEVKLKDTHRL